MGKTVLIIGALDTKGEEYAFIKKLIEARGHKTLVLHIGVYEPHESIKPDIPNSEVANIVNADISDIQKMDRGPAMKIMSQGTAEIVRKLFAEKRFDGAIGMGGTGGTSVITAGLQTLPIGVPKVMVSTAASGDTRAYVGTRDIVMFPSVVDVAGINRISRQIFTRAVGAICGMVESEIELPKEEKPIITASMFGNTTPCVDRCRENLTSKGYEVLVFHATGTGGKTMESIVEDGLVDAVLDITTTEWADEICGGVFSAGRARLDAPGKMGIPHLIVPGCVDMVNFGPKDTVPDKYVGRLFYEWNPSVTLMRTTPEENAEMGRIFAEKANLAKGPVAFLLPLKGVSMLDSEGQLFWSPDADSAMFNAIKSNIRKDIKVVELNANINDTVFADRAVEMLLGMLSVS
ncbi:MAG: Tm-1-like ATP-binding domain-containing protein [Candidatus Poribacteria bacterium]